MKDYKEIIPGSTFPDAPYKNNVKISFTKEVLNEYIPAVNKVTENDPLGLRLLMIIMTEKEGFHKGTRSYRTNNPGNIGNTDIGANKTIDTLEEGIKYQRKFILDIAAGRKKAFPLNTIITLKPSYSKEIAKNPKIYGMSPYLPGYRFLYTGQLDQFIKFYSTGARAGNNYINTIISFFKNHGIEITPETRIQDIITILAS